MKYTSTKKCVKIKSNDKKFPTSTKLVKSNHLKGTTMPVNR